MNKVREYYNKNSDWQREECNYINVLGLALLLKRNRIEKIEIKSYKDIDKLISKKNKKENLLAKKILDNMLLLVGRLSCDNLETTNCKNAKAIFDNIQKEEIQSKENDDDLWTFRYFIEQSLAIAKFSESEIIEEIIRPLEDYMIDDYNDAGYHINEDISKLMVQVLNIEKNAQIAIWDLECKMGGFNNNGILESQVILQIQNSNIDAYYTGNKKLNREIREYAVNHENKNIAKNLYKENIDKSYDYIIVNPEIIERTSKYDNFKVEQPIVNELGLSNITNTVSISFWMATKMLDALNKTGKGIVAFSLASLSNISEREFRKQLIDKNCIEKVIKVGNYLLVIFNKSKKEENVNFIDLSDCILSKTYNYSINARTSLDMKKVVQNCKNNFISVTKEKVEENGYSLNPAIYMKKIRLENAIKLDSVLEGMFRGYQASKIEMNKMRVKELEEANYKMLEIGNINDDGEIASTLTLIDSKKIERNFDRYLLKDGDIVITARGEKIKLAYITLKENEKIIANGTINVIRVDKTKINPRYLKMFLDSPKGKQTLENIKIGREKTPSLNTGDLKKIEIPCPSKEEQDLIANQYEKIKENIDKLKRELNDIINKF